MLLCIGLFVVIVLVVRFVGKLLIGMLVVIVVVFLVSILLVCFMIVLVLCRMDGMLVSCVVNIGGNVGYLLNLVIILGLSVLIMLCVWSVLVRSLIVVLVRESGLWLWMVVEEIKCILWVGNLELYLLVCLLVVSLMI